MNLLSLRSWAGVCFLCISCTQLICYEEVRAQDTATEKVETDPGKLAERLKSGEPEQRWRAAEELGQLGVEAKSQVPALLDALKDEQPIVRQQAARALGLIGDDSERVIKALMRLVGDENPGVRLTSVTSLRKLVSDPAELVPLAADLLAEEDQLLASRAVETLILRGEKAVPFLVEALKNERAAYWACLAIEELGEVAEPAVPALKTLLSKTESETLRIQAILALASIGSEAVSAKQELLAALRPTAKPNVQAAAAYAAGKLGLKGAAERLEKTADSDDEMLSMVSTWALAKLDPDDENQTKAAVRALVDGLASDDPAMRLFAAEGIESLQPDPSLVAENLTSILNEADPVVALNIADAVASLGEPVAERVAGALESDELKWLAVEVLERLGPNAKPAVPEVVAAMRDATGEYRERLQNSLRSIGPAAAPATTELVRSLDSDDQDLRTSALLAIGSIGPGAEAAKPVLLARLSTLDEGLEKTLTAWALANVAPSDDEAASKAVPVLAAALKEADLPVKVGAASALATLGSNAQAALDELDALANQQDAPDLLRRAASEAAATIRQGSP